MTRDYKPAARARKAPSSGSGSSLLVGIVIGLLLGLGIALGVAIYLNKVPGPFVLRPKSSEPGSGTMQGLPESAPKPQVEQPSAKSEEKPRFDFYNILPSTDDATNDAAKDRAAKDAARRAPVEPKETFYLQAGAFQSAAEADNMKARLALLGIEAVIRTNSTANRGLLHRIRVGPFTRVEELNRIRDTLKQNGIETTLSKGRETPN
jgi:cell division protein FtsN